MTYAVIGSGAIGTAVARQFARQNIPLLVANSRGPASIEPLADELGLAIIPSELQTALAADVVILAVPFDAVPGLLKDVTNWNGRIIVDATNAIDFTDFSPADLDGRPSSDVVADAAPGARVVKALNHLFARVLARVAEDSHGRRTLFIAGNDADAKFQVGELLRSFGFAVIDLGLIQEGGLLQQFGGSLTTHSLIMQKQDGTSLPEMDIIDG